MSSNNFLRISNDFFDNKDKDREKPNLIKLIGTEGFTIYTYILYQQGSNTSVNITIKNIQSFFTRNYEDRPILETYKDRLIRINCLKDARTINNYIKVLSENKIITIHNLNDLVLGNIQVNQSIIVSCNYTDANTGFNAISSLLFLDYVHKIGHVGWSLLCLLSRLQNNTYGDGMSEGFSNPKELTMTKMLDIGLSSVKAYVGLLEQMKLIIVKHQGREYAGENKYGKPIFNYLPNHYYVKHKTPGTKYYIDMSKKE